MDQDEALAADTHAAAVGPDVDAVVGTHLLEGFVLIHGHVQPGRLECYRLDGGNFLNGAAIDLSRGPHWDLIDNADSAGFLMGRQHIFQRGSYVVVGNPAHHKSNDRLIPAGLDRVGQDQGVIDAVYIHDGPAHLFQIDPVATHLDDMVRASGDHKTFAAMGFHPVRYRKPTAAAYRQFTGKKGRADVQTLTGHAPLDAAVRREAFFAFGSAAGGDTAGFRGPVDLHQIHARCLGKCRGVGFRQWTGRGKSQPQGAFFRRVFPECPVVNRHAYENGGRRGGHLTFDLFGKGGGLCHDPGRCRQGHQQGIEQSVNVPGRDAGQDAVAAGDLITLYQIIHFAQQIARRLGPEARDTGGSAGEQVDPGPVGIGFVFGRQGFDFIHQCRCIDDRYPGWQKVIG